MLFSMEATKQTDLSVAQHVPKLFYKNSAQPHRPRAGLGRQYGAQARIIVGDGVHTVTNKEQQRVVLSGPTMPTRN